MMEQRSEIIKRFNTNRKQSLLLESEVNGRVISLRIRKPSTSDFEDAIPFIHSPVASQPIDELSAAHQQQQQQQQSGGEGSGTSGGATISPQEQQQQDLELGGQPNPTRPNFCLNNLKPDETNVRRMQTALTLNKAIVDRSKSAKLVIINLPGAPKESTPEAENNCKLTARLLTYQLSLLISSRLTRNSYLLYPLLFADMEFVEIITEGLDRVLLVQNGDREVITIHS